MISKGIITLVVLLLILPISLSGEELLVEVLSSTRGFEDVNSIISVRSIDGRDFFRFQMEGDLYWAISEETDTKSGRVNYIVILDSDLVIVHFAIPDFENKHNASLTSSAFLRQFKKESPVEDPIQLGYGVDAISGATSSTVSLIDAVNASVLILDEIRSCSEL